MLSEFVLAIKNWMLHWTGTPYANLMLFAIAFAESSFFPIPPDILLIAMCLASPKSAFLLALICTIASASGGLFGMLIGRYGGRPILNRFFDAKKIEWAESLYKKYDSLAIAVSGFTPIPYKIFTVLAGALGISYKTLFFVSILARGARFFSIAALLYFFGETMQVFIEEQFKWLTIAFGILLVGGFFAMKVLANRKSQA